MGRYGWKSNRLKLKMHDEPTIYKLVTSNFFLILAWHKHKNENVAGDWSTTPKFRPPSVQVQTVKPPTSSSLRTTWSTRQRWSKVYVNMIWKDSEPHCLTTFKNLCRNLIKSWNNWSTRLKWLSWTDGPTKKVVFYHDHTADFNVDPEFVKLWRSVAVESIDDDKIHEYMNPIDGWSGWSSNCLPPEAESEEACTQRHRAHVIRVGKLLRDDRWSI